MEVTPIQDSSLQMVGEDSIVKMRVSDAFRGMTGR